MDPEQGSIRADADSEVLLPEDDIRLVDAESVAEGHPGLRVIATAGEASFEQSLDEDEEIRLDPDPGVGIARPPDARSNARDLYRAIGLMLAGSDVLCLAAALLVSPAMTVGRAPIPLPLVLVASAVWVAVFHGFRLYAPQHLSSAEMFRRVLSASSVGTFLLLVIAVGTTPALSRAWMGLTWALVMLFELATRRFWNWWLFRLKTSRRLAYRTLVIGTNEEARRLSEVMEDSSFGYEPVGLVAPPGLLEGRPDVKILGRLEDLESTIEHHAADCIFVASTAVTVDQMAYVQRVVRRAGIELRVSANLPEILSSRLTVKPVGEVMAISLRPVTLTGTQAILKRSFDLLLASLGLLLALPLIAVVALLIKISSPGPVIFRQERISRGGRAFTVYKFRTMVHNADRVFEANQIDRTEAFFKARETESITAIGRILRRLSLDELPQLWNIVKGDMSIVGPRPLPAEQVAANLELLEPRHEVRAGLTGWWQINGRSDVDPVDAVRMDLFYIENWSLTLDLYIVLKTFGILIAGKGAY